MTYYVYRLFDADARCLYVGATAELHIRLRRARARSWGPQIMRADVTYHADRPSALEVEASQIRALEPLHNTLHREGIQRLAKGDLTELIIGAIAARGPMTQVELERELMRGTGPRLPRLVADGKLAIVAERPSAAGRHKFARVYGVVAA